MSVLRQCTVALAVLVAAHGPAFAAWPEKPVKIVHAFPGTPVDAAVRFLADRLSAMWKQPVVVEPRPGASEIIAGDAVAKATPDGYTLLVGLDGNFSLNQYLFAKLPFNPERDLVPVSELIEIPFCLVVSGSYPANTLKEFAQAAGKGSVAYASLGNGSPNHLSMEKIARTLGVSMMHVPYKAGSPALQDLATDRVNAMVMGINGPAAFLPDRRMKILAVSGTKRQKAQPNVPTFEEAGYPQLSVHTFVGLAAPRGTPAEVVQKIAEDVRIVLTSEEAEQKIGYPLGYTLIGSNPGQFSEFLMKERAEAQRLIRTLGVKLD